MNKIKETLDGPNGGVSMYQCWQGSVRMSQLHLLRLTRDFKSTPKTCHFLYFIQTVIKAKSQYQSRWPWFSYRVSQVLHCLADMAPSSADLFLFNSLQLIYGLVVSIRPRVAEGHCSDWKVLPGEQCLSLWARNKFDFWFRLFLKHLSKPTCLIAEEPPPAA